MGLHDMIAIRRIGRMVEVSVVDRSDMYMPGIWTQVTGADLPRCWVRKRAWINRAHERPGGILVGYLTCGI
jgi:hypothetical protein